MLGERGYFMVSYLLLSGTDDLLVVLGGFGSHQNMVDTVEKFDPKHQTWNRLPVRGDKSHVLLSWVISSIKFHITMGFTVKGAI